MEATEHPDELKDLTMRAQVRADMNNTPHMVVYREHRLSVIPAVEYRHEMHGACERIRYPRAYQHPPLVSARLW